jgi:cytochrome c-type biogenesis protein CcsB
MNDAWFLNLAFGVLILAEIAYIVGFLIRRQQVETVVVMLLVAGCSLLTISIASRWLDAGHPPFTTMYESLVFFAWATTVAFFFMKRRGVPLWLGAPVTALVILALAYASLLDDTITPLLPALRSNWLTIHVISYFLAYGVLAVSFVASAIVLFNPAMRAGAKPDRQDNDHSQQLDNIGYRGVAVGFPLLTIGLVTGAVWAARTWGRYWGWDPKETMSLVCWLIYAAYLHVRLVHGWTGKRAAIVSFIGFLFVIFTYLGLKYLPIAVESLHRYI